MKILFATSECAPFVKTGGLADVAGSLPAALGAGGDDVRILLPAYPAVARALGQCAAGAVVPLPAAAELPAAQLVPVQGPGGVQLLLLHCPALYARPGNPYLGPDGRDWPDNDLRFGLLSRAAAVLSTDASPLAWRPDVLHCNDWQTALAPAYLAYESGRRAGSVLTVHNLAYQGCFDPPSVARLALPPESFTIDGIEYYGRMSFLKGGLACADAITTVSPTYAREICTEELGFGMQGLLRARAHVLGGILNGIDTALWDPAHDPHIAQRFDAHTLGGKAVNKRALQQALGLAPDPTVPVLAIVSRLVAQKGIDLVADVLDAIVALPAQVVVQGLGDADLEERLLALGEAYPGRVAVRIAFDEALVHRIEAGADIFLMPSRFEPCGMNQMFSQRYGTLPVVCRTGGLADSVTDCTLESLAEGKATGFSFAPPTAAALLAAVQRAHRLFHDTAAWKRMQRSAMARDFSWAASAARYREVYARVAARP